jgi:hypothetical protein
MQIIEWAQFEGALRLSRIDTTIFIDLRLYFPADYTLTGIYMDLNRFSVLIA